MLCQYGCGKEGKFKTTTEKWCCSKSYNSCESIRKKNSLGLSKAHKDGRLKSWPKTNCGWAKGKNAYSDTRVRTKVKHNEIFIIGSKVSNSFVKKILIDEKLLPYKCICGNEGFWNDEKLILELDHKNGDNRDYRKCNLRFLCPNCHSQTKTYCGRNIKNLGKKKVSDDKILNLIGDGLNNRQILLEVRLKADGGNYPRIEKLRRIGGICRPAEFKPQCS